MRPKFDAPADTGLGRNLADSNAHDADTMASPVLSSVHPDIVESDLIDTNDLVDDVSTGETLPGPRAVGSPAASPIAQFDRKHEIMTTMTVHITSRHEKGSKQAAGARGALLIFHQPVDDQWTEPPGGGPWPQAHGRKY